MAYVAATRAKKVCVWLAEPDEHSVVEHVQPDGISRLAVNVEMVGATIARHFD